MKIKSLILLLFIFVFTCCTKDDIPPTIPLSVLDNLKDTVLNEYQLEITASDKSGIASVECFVNDSLIVTGNSIPFLYTLNTLDYEDGKYTIGIKVTDNNGNQSELEKSVVINNKLLVLNLGSLYNVPYQYVLSDEAGKVLKTGTFKMEEITVVYPDEPYTGEGINLSYYLLSNGYTHISSYIHIKRGSEFKLDLSYTPPPANYFTLHLKNDIPAFSKLLVQTDRAYYELNSINDTINLPQFIPYSKDHKLYLRLTTLNGDFYGLIDVINNGSVSVNLSAINSQFETKTITLPSARPGSYLINGRAVKEDVYNNYAISSGNTDINGSQLTLKFPDEYFAEYRTQLTWAPDQSRFYFDVYCGTIPSSFEAIDVSINIINPSPEDFSASISGNFDRYIVKYWQSSPFGDNEIFAPASKSSWKLPDLATVFNRPDFNDYTYPAHITFWDLSGIDWRTGYYDLETDFEKLNMTNSHHKSLLLEYR